MGVQPAPILSPVVDPVSRRITEVWLGFFRTLTDTAEAPVIGAGDIGTTELADAAVTLTKLASVLIKVTGSRAGPTSITAAGGIAPAGKWFEAMFVQGSVNPTDITVNPQIAAGTAVGQFLLLIGRGNALQMDDGTGISQNGSIILDADDCVLYMWDGTNWVEVVRSDKS
jgi:hypothetical protein